MASLNKIIILGNVLSEPESRFSVEGVPVSKFTMPIDNGPNQPKGSIEVVAFRNLAETATQVCRKGSNVLVEGKIQVRSYDDQSGNRKWVTEILASSIYPQDSVKEQKGGGKQEVAVASDEEEIESIPEDDLPF